MKSMNCIDLENFGIHKVYRHIECPSIINAKSESSRGYSQEESTFDI
jgi:hypothetical protein